VAEGVVVANIFTQADQQGVVFIEHSDISGQIIHKERLVGSIAIATRCQTNAVDYAPSISINNKNWLARSIQYYGVGGLLANAMDGKKLLAEIVNIIGKKPIKVVVKVFAKPVSKGLEL